MTEISKQIFTALYNTNGFGSLESKSGPGSTLEKTKTLTPFIIDVIKKYNIQSVTDFPCGDLNWVNGIWPQINQYVGCDIVENCIKDNQAKYPTGDFRCLDLSCDEIPAADLLIVRDVLGHQPIEVALQMVENILKSKCKYLLSTTWAKKTGDNWTQCQQGEILRENQGVNFGGFYPVNLMSSPFNFPLAEEFHKEDVFVDDHEAGYAKTLALWDLSKIKNAVLKQVVEVATEPKPTETQEQPKLETQNIQASVSKIENLTIVSGLWNIAREGRDFSVYEEHFDKFLKIPCNMVLWIPKSLESFVWERRSKKNTFVKIYELEDIKNSMFAPFAEKAEAIRTNPEWLNLTGEGGWLPNSPQASNKWYNPIVMSKMFFVHDSKIWNPFDTDYFVWLDAGITQTCYENYFYEPKILEGIRDKIDPFLFLSYPYEACDEIHGFKFKEMNKYAGKKVEYVCRGGLFGSHKDFLSQTNSLYYELLGRSLSEGLMGTEESIFSIMANLHPENFKRYELDGNGLVVKFIQALEKNEADLAEVKTNAQKFEPIVSNISKIKTHLYFLTFNYPEQLEFTIKSLEKHEGFLTHPVKKFIIDNSTSSEAIEGNKRLCEIYGFEYLPREKNTGICGGRQFAAEHFDESDADFYLFFEDDMTISNPDEGICRNGFQKYIPDLYKKLHQIMLKENFDYLKLSFTEVYMDNHIQVSWYNVPQAKRDELWPNYNKLPVTGLDPNSPRTKFNKIDMLDGLAYISGEIYYANWPMIVNRQGNKKMFINTKWAHPYEQTWMSHIFQETLKGELNPAVLLASPVTHERFKYYKPEERIEG